MIVPKDTAKAIAAGRKTTIRVLARPGKAGARWAPIPFKMAATYPIGHRERDTPNCHVVVTDIRRAHAGDISLHDARAEGHRTTDLYREAFVREHDRDWMDHEKPDLAAIFGDNAVAFILLKRFDERWRDADVWVVRFELTADVPRFMAVQRGRAVGDGQYVPTPTRAISDAECIPDALQESFARAAGPWGEAKRDVDRKRSERARVQARADRRPWARAA